MSSVYLNEGPLIYENELSKIRGVGSLEAAVRDSLQGGRDQASAWRPEVLGGVAALRYLGMLSLCGFLWTRKGGKKLHGWAYPPGASWQGDGSPPSEEEKRPAAHAIRALRKGGPRYDISRSGKRRREYAEKDELVSRSMLEAYDEVLLLLSLELAGGRDMGTITYLRMSTV
ncbi:hypothetical protein BS47DRAFT_1361760 [Hydnum rufescens UP504]|uniref:Uncharacterized protein n=1 Tax=Hydnum rufescens UP504 TaxID=1448309 RepID=A0A9P6AZT3_9AGAM|nr:hypothetical protein BS47DRAFT_1361760 [Hydnum rufescens UP504]